MLERPTFRKTFLPIILAFCALVILNWGLYTRLRATEVVVSIALPYENDFSTSENEGYSAFGGDWELRDETLVQLSTSGYDLGTLVPLAIPSDQSIEFRTRLRFLGGSMGGGIMFYAQQLNSRQGSHMARFNVDNGVVYLIYGYFDETAFIGQGASALTLAPDDTNWQTLSVRTNAETYSLFFNEQVIAADIPLQYKGGAVGFLSSTSQFAFDDVSVTALTSDTQEAALPEATDQEAVPPIESTPTLITPEATSIVEMTTRFNDSFDGAAGSSNWVPFSGTWEVRDGAFVQTLPEGFDLSAGSREALNPQSFQVTLRHLQGVGGGLMFNMGQPDSRNGAVMVRYIDQEAISWGYFDDTGAYVGIDGRIVGAPGDTAHTLGIVMNGNTFSIILDGATIAENIPFEPRGGHIGLTTSQSVVAFDSVEVFGVVTTEGAVVESPPLPTTQIDLSTISGAWTNENGIITQTNEGAVDSIAGLGVAAEVFTVNISILLPQGVADAGAGLVFHMAGRDDSRGGQMIRFGAGGNEILWGFFNADNAFQGQGGIPIALSPSQPHDLMLVVRVGTFDIVVDGQTIATDIPLASSNGWIGLVSFRGPVVYSNFNLTLGGG